MAFETELAVQRAEDDALCTELKGLVQKVHDRFVEVEVANAQLIQDIHAKFVEMGAAITHFMRHLQAKFLEVESAIAGLVAAHSQGSPPGGPLFDPCAGAAAMAAPGGAAGLGT